MGTDRKLSALSALSGSNASNSDLMHVLDVSEAADVDKNKSLTLAELAVKMEAINNPSPTSFDLISYIPVFSVGFGTVTNVQFYYSLQDNVHMNIWGRMKCGTTTVALAEIGLPIGYKVHTSFVATVGFGPVILENITTVRNHIVATGGDIFFGVGRADAGTDGLEIMTTSLGLPTGWEFSFSMQLPVEVV